MNKLLPLISFMFLLALPSTAYAKDELIVIKKRVVMVNKERIIST